MNGFKFLLFIISVIILFAHCGKQNQKWEVLFDGKSTDAWRAFKRDTFPTDGWTIENGALKTIVGGDQVDIITKKQYLNFELELWWKVAPAGNSGIFYHVSEDAPSTWESAPEMQILDDTAHPDAQKGKTSAGALYDLIAPSEDKVLKPLGEFNKVRLIVNNGHVEHWMNGVKIVEYQLGNEELKALIAESKFKDIPYFATGEKGHIGLQHHGQEVWFRDIRVRSLD